MLDSRQHQFCGENGHPASKNKGNWTALSHVQVGGVLKGSWKIGHSKGWDDWSRLKRKSNVTPGVRDILDTTLSGHEVDPCTTSDEIITHLDTVPRANIAVVQVLAPSVFSSTGWCTRSLGADEIMNAFDVDFAVRKKFKNQYQPSDLPFLAQPPAKVIFRAMDCAKSVPLRSGKCSLAAMMADGDEQLSPPTKVACQRPWVTPEPSPTPTPGPSP